MVISTDQVNINLMLRRIYVRTAATGTSQISVNGHDRSQLHAPMCIQATRRDVNSLNQ